MNRPALGLSPADVAQLAPEALPGVMLELAALQTALAARLATAGQAENGEQPEPGEDGMLTPEAAARIAGLTVDALRRRKAFRPAIVKLGHRTLRVDERKLRRILARMSG